MSNKPIKQVRFRTNENGGIEGGPPHPPGNPFLLGSDHYGFSILDQLIVGAKYTILGALIIVTLRIVIGFLFGVIYAFILNQKTQKIFEKITDSIHFIPLTVIAFILLRPVLINTNSEIWMYDLTGRIIIEITILTVLVIPLTSVLIGNEIKDAMNFEYVESSKILGGGRLWILKKHILPNIGQRLALLFGRQFNQVLTIFIHLGVFELFFGGTIQEKYNMPQRSFTHEWAGIIGANKDAILTGKHWLIIWALLAYIICSVTMQLFIRGIQELQEKKIEKKKSSAIHNKEDNEYVTSQISQEQSLVKKDDFKIISKY
nr:ABC transporter permease subunit [Pontibacillus yanchengensis]